ncbi:hypothetical protein H5410_040336 [Solanum commersonii]|uniref:Uncharacterized protein n=1 Tax=Solanum commersonii TaxID=4109 RepID=A0A9J5XS77_SOLCO|nr:hypothetical protein H5410_040336 [Solanum commersonii]
MLNGAESWPIKNSHVQKMNVVEMRMQRWICGHTRRDEIKSEDVPDKMEVASVMDQLREVKLKWLGM